MSIKDILKSQFPKEDESQYGRQLSERLRRFKENSLILFGRIHEPPINNKLMVKSLLSNKEGACGCAAKLR